MATNCISNKIYLANPVKSLKWYIQVSSLQNHNRESILGGADVNLILKYLFPHFQVPPTRRSVYSNNGHSLRAVFSCRQRRNPSTFILSIQNMYINNIYLKHVYHSTHSEPHVSLLWVTYAIASHSAETPTASRPISLGETHKT